MYTITGIRSRPLVRDLENAIYSVFQCTFNILTLSNCFFSSDIEMSPRVCDMLDKKRWQKYDPSTVSAPKPVIYNMSKKESGLKKPKLLYTGRTKNLKTRLQRHSREKFKRYDKSKLRVKSVFEPKQKTMERAYIECQRKKGNHPLLNKRAGDGPPSRAKGRKKKTKDSGSGRLTLEEVLFIQALFGDSVPYRR